MNINRHAPVQGVASRAFRRAGADRDSPYNERLKLAVAFDARSLAAGHPITEKIRD